MIEEVAKAALKSSKAPLGCTTSKPGKLRVLGVNLLIASHH